MIAALLATLVLLGGCVSTTERVFTEEASPKKALETRVSLARRYISDGNWEDAKRNLELAREIDPGSADVHEAFGLLYQRTGELELAEESFESSISLDRNCSRCRNNYAAFLYSQERYAEAEKQLERVVKDSLYSGRPLAFVNLGLCRRQLLDAQGAEEAFVRALSMDRSNRIALLELAQIRFEAGDVARANEYYTRYRSLVRKQSAAGLWLGIRLARKTGDQDAEASYQLALGSLYPDSAEFRAYQRIEQSE
tara:strand:+ start:2300 stop:3058 length:759 start_codon:yes stop_codon:yes gene_type:complete